VSGTPQDARISIPGERLDIRVNLIPSLFGEKLVLRLLDQKKTFSLEKTGLDRNSLSAIQWALSQENGVALFTGPTGSGKSTLLYSALSSLDRAGLNIVTIEDPIEYTFSGITQVQVSSKISMADALRAMLRQDPDVILLGEVRDPETASLCFQAASTGHLVLSTLHANSASEVEARLLSLGIRSDQIKACLRFSSAQRLLGKLCPSCKLKSHLQGFRRSAEGCLNCRYGLVGRLPIFEFEKIGPSIERSSSLSESVNRLILSGEIDAGMVSDAA
jgi:type IV pilus assembly protein PilB